MSESYGFFDSDSNDVRQYRADEFTEFFRNFFTSGVCSGLGITTQGGMNIGINTGYSVLKGYYYKNDTLLLMSLSAADTNLPRVDRVVLRLDLVARTIHANIKKGAPASNPTPPTLQRDQTVFEISLAKISVPAAASNIQIANITDERYNSDVCGAAGAIVRPLTVLSSAQPANLVAGDIWIQYLG